MWWHPMWCPMLPCCRVRVLPRTVDSRSVGFDFHCAKHTRITEHGFSAINQHRFAEFSLMVFFLSFLCVRLMLSSSYRSLHFAMRALNMEYLRRLVRLIHQNSKVILMWCVDLLHLSLRSPVGSPIMACTYLCAWCAHNIRTCLCVKLVNAFNSLSEFRH